MMTNISALSVNKEDFHQSKKRKSEMISEDESLFVESLDTEIIINSIYDLLSHHKSKNFTIIFLHQVYSYLTNKSLVDEEIETLRRTHKYKILNSSYVSSLIHDFTPIIETERYINDLRRFLKIPVQYNSLTETSAYKVDDCYQESLLIVEKFRYLMNNNCQRSIFLKDIAVIDNNDFEISLSSFNDSKLFTMKEIGILISIGFLKSRNDLNNNNHLNNNEDMFWLSHPSLVTAINHMMISEKQIKSLINKTRYKEISERKLFEKFNQLENNLLPVEYFLMDLYGRGVLNKVKSPGMNDFIIRCCK